MLFCITANYTAKALNAMRENPTVNRRAAVEEMATAAGVRLVAMYGTIAEGPGVLAIVDGDPVAVQAIIGTVTSSDGVRNVRLQRLLSDEEVIAVRQKRAEIYSSYKPPA